MANGQYRILEAQLPLVGGLGGHNMLVLVDPDGRIVDEIDGVAVGADGKEKAIGWMPSDRLNVRSYAGRHFYEPHFAQTELVSGDQATIMNLWNAAHAARVKMDELDSQYPFLGMGQNSNSVASTLIAAMGLIEPSMPGGAPIMPGARSMLLEPKVIQDIQRQFHITAPRQDDTPTAAPAPDEAGQPSPIDPARVSIDPMEAPSESANAPQIPDPGAMVTPRPDLRDPAPPRAQGPAFIGKPNGPIRLVPPAPSRSSAPANPTTRAADPLPPLHYAPETPQRIEPFEMPGLFRSDAFGSTPIAPATDGTGTSPSIPPTPSFGAPGVSAPTLSPGISGMARLPGTGNPVLDWWNGLAAHVDAVGRRSGFGGLNTPMLGGVPTPPTQPRFDSGLPGLLARFGAFDPPAGGLVGMLREHLRNNPDDNDVSA